MSEKVCPNCGKKYKLSLKDRLLRKQVTLIAKQFLALKSVTELAKDYCNDCWKERVKPMALATAGVEESE